MGYSGYREFLCANGHKDAVDAYGDDPKACGFCKAPITHRHSVDLTNGEEEGVPCTKPAPVEEVGFDDDWRTDHHGNKYSLRVPKYKPISEWREVKS